MLSALLFPPSDLFSNFCGDMDSEIAELRTMTRVTKLRQQIECRQEGAWMSVRDVPDDRSKGGTRKVTSYGRATRSVTRSFSSNTNLEGTMPKESAMFRPKTQHNVVVEFPDDDTNENETTSKPNFSVEITEVECDSTATPPEPAPTKSNPPKKTSVVTVGQGNVVLIDPQDSNFTVTGITEDLNNDIPLRKTIDKKVKKVGFSKTEVHFAPDSGKVNIVETDGKPPSSQLLRKKKRQKKDVPSKDAMPHLYFGDLEKPKSIDKPTGEHIFPVIRQPSPLLSMSITTQSHSSTFKGPTVYKVEVNEESKPHAPIINSLNKEKPDAAMNYLRNVSPKLSKLINNSIQHEFQLKQMEILNKSRASEVTVSKTDVTVATKGDKQHCINIHMSPESSSQQIKAAKIVTQVNVNLEDIKPKPKPEKPASPRTAPSEPHGQSQVVTVVQTPLQPKPRSSLTKIVVNDNVKDRKRPKLPAHNDKPPRKTGPSPKKEQSASRQTRTCSRSSVRSTESSKRSKTIDKKPVKASKTVPSESKVDCGRVKKTKEPLRNFEKVSNGWVGHCIVPVKTTKTGMGVTVTTATAMTAAATKLPSSKTRGVMREVITAERKTSKTLQASNTPVVRGTLSTTSKQFSLSKEHLKSAKLVKELYRGNDTQIPSAPRPVRPNSLRIKPTEDKPKNLVSRRRMLYEEGHRRLRKDSEQSDDSVVRADEEVRAFMSSSRNKVLTFRAGGGIIFLFGILVGGRNQQTNFVSHVEGGILTNNVVWHVAGFGLFKTLSFVYIPVLKLFIAHITRVHYV